MGAAYECRNSCRDPTASRLGRLHFELRIRVSEQRNRDSHDHADNEHDQRRGDAACVSRLVRAHHERQHKLLFSFDADLFRVSTLPDVTGNHLNFTTAAGISCGTSGGGGGGGGTLTSVSGSSPIVATPNPIGATGALSCPTCAVANASLTSGKLIAGAGGQAEAIITTPTQCGQGKRQRESRIQGRRMAVSFPAVRAR